FGDIEITPACPAGYDFDMKTRLCFKPCAEGFQRNGNQCKRTCPADYRDDGVDCFRDADSVSVDWYSLPRASYEKCNDGYVAWWNGLVIEYECVKKCPSGYGLDMFFLIRRCYRHPHSFPKNNYFSQAIDPKNTARSKCSFGRWWEC